jgi:hypothetical protein
MAKARRNRGAVPRVADSKGFAMADKKPKQASATMFGQAFLEALRPDDRPWRLMMSSFPGGVARDLAELRALRRLGEVRRQASLRKNLRRRAANDH